MKNGITKKIDDAYYRDFREDNILTAKYDNGIIKTESWTISISLVSDDVVSLSTVSMQGLSIGSWVRTLFGQKLFSIEENEYIRHFSNAVYVSEFSDEYFIRMINLILKSNLPPSVIVKSIEFINH